jgi:hypothetical protein
MVLREFGDDKSVTLGPILDKNSYYYKHLKGSWLTLDATLIKNL